MAWTSKYFSPNVNHINRKCLGHMPYSVSKINSHFKNFLNNGLSQPQNKIKTILKFSADSTFEALDLNMLKRFQKHPYGYWRSADNIQVSECFFAKASSSNQCALGGLCSYISQTCILEFVNNKKQTNGTTVSIAESALLTASRKLPCCNAGITLVTRPT